ncbi:MAG: 6-phosphofructokinase [Actinobacteria bacterium]|nr:6-phosphofructokinase [Actinomycetota bacterium]
MIRGKSIGIITSGGDCGGLNAVIKGAAFMAISYGIDVYLIPNGFAGLYNLFDSENIVKLDIGKIDQISSMIAGSEAGNSRVKISGIEDKDKYKKINAGLQKFNIGALVISGGDDTGSAVIDLNDSGIPCIHVPKTMDLDLQTYSVGGDSTINRIAQYINDIKTTGKSHNRIMIVEIFGRYAGHTAFRGGIAADADCILIPEVPIDFNVIYEHMKKIYIRRVSESENKAGTYIIVVAEGIKDSTGMIITDESAPVDSFGHKKLSGSGKYVLEHLSELIKNDPQIVQFMKKQGLFVEKMNEVPEIRETVPGYLARSGSTSALDVNFGKEAGAGAVVLLINGISGVTVTCVVDGNIEYIPTKFVIKQRFVKENMIAFYEKMGICFGRNSSTYIPIFNSLKQSNWCYL